MTAAQFQARRSPDLRLFPWVQYHSPAQIAFVQFDTELRMMPYGAAIKMLTMHHDTEVASHSDGLREDGNGLGVLATSGDDELVIELWNLQPDGETAVDVAVDVAGLPAGPHRVRRYLIDTTHSNPLTGPPGPGGLELVDEQTADGERLRLLARLEPMALCLWTIRRG